MIKLKYLKNIEQIVKQTDIICYKNYLIRYNLTTHLHDKDRYKDFEFVCEEDNRILKVKHKTPTKKIDWNRIKHIVEF